MDSLEKFLKALIYISVFGPVPYCLDDCGFVVEPEVRQVDSSLTDFTVSRMKRKVLILTFKIKYNYLVII